MAKLLNTEILGDLNIYNKEITITDPFKLNGDKITGSFICFYIGTDSSSGTSNKYLFIDKNTKEEYYTTTLPEDINLKKISFSNGNLEVNTDDNIIINSNIARLITNNAIINANENISISTPKIEVKNNNQRVLISNSDIIVDELTDDTTTKTIISLEGKLNKNLTKSANVFFFSEIVGTASREKDDNDILNTIVEKSYGTIAIIERVSTELTPTSSTITYSGRTYTWNEAERKFKNGSTNLEDNVKITYNGSQNWYWDGNVIRKEGTDLEQIDIIKPGDNTKIGYNSNVYTWNGSTFNLPGNLSYPILVKYNDDSVYLNSENKLVTYKRTAYSFNGTSWKAFDGNYNAKNVFLDRDMIITKTFGKHVVETGSKTPYTRGTSLDYIFTDAFCEELCGNITNPWAALTVSANKTGEVGSSFDAPIATITVNPGKYLYGPYDTGVTFSYKIKDSANNETSGNLDPAVNSSQNISNNTANITHATNNKIFLDSVIEHSFNGTYSYTDGCKAISNLGRISNEKIIERNNINLGNKIVTFTGWRYMYFKDSNKELTNEEFFHSNNKSQNISKESINFGKHIYIGVPDGKTVNFEVYDDFKQKYVSLEISIVGMPDDLIIIPENKRTSNNGSIILKSDNNDLYSKKYKFYSFEIDTSAKSKYRFTCN